MILYDHERRWAEVKFYRFLIDVFSIRQKTIDIIHYIDLVCDLYDISHQVIRKVINIMLSQDYYSLAKKDLIILSREHGLSGAAIGRYVGMTGQGVNKYIKAQGEDYTPAPHFYIEEDREIIKFLEALEKLKKLGQIEDGKAYTIPIRQM